MNDWYQSKVCSVILKHGDIFIKKQIFLINTVTVQVKFVYSHIKLCFYALPVYSSFKLS